jgi:hypothetical protein
MLTGADEPSAQSANCQGAGTALVRRNEENDAEPARTTGKRSVPLVNRSLPLEYGLLYGAHFTIYGTKIAEIPI